VLGGRYQIVALLGEGGMGEVYRTEDLLLGQAVALKFLPEALARNEDALRRFRNEVRLARQVSHPNVCRVHDVGEADGQIFLTMEYVDGEDLASLLRRIGHLPQEKAIEIARKLCAGLAAAHDKGVLHRDLKPANVMLDGRGEVLLTDFGLAGLPEEIGGAEVRSGTPAYMAPEQLAGREVTPRSDIYSLGLVLYELFTGRRPFEGSTLAELIRARSEVTPASLSSHVRDLDPAVERVILRCLEPEPFRRPPSALAVAAALPGGDPLAAALAAGETPSPQMVAAAGEGAGVSLRVAVPLFTALLAGFAAHIFLAHRSSALEMAGPKLSPEVLRQKAREAIERAGYAGEAADDAHGLWWDEAFLRYAAEHEKPYPKWGELLRGRTPVLRYWYRQSPVPLTAGEFHDDLLTPGVVGYDDPPRLISGMVNVKLDSSGRLLEFHAVVPQFQDKPGKPAPADWTPLFAAAGLDPAQLQPAEPQWNFTDPADTRAAWTGNWPGTERPLRVEASAWQGKPVGFALLGPWTTPDRMPSGDNSVDARTLVIVTIALVTIVAAPLLARNNLQRGRGDRRGAARLAAFIFAVHMTLWLTRAHFAPSIGTVAMLLLAICTSVFYAAVIWTFYLALEPYIRRHWPHAIISSTRVLAGQIRDPIVGRDILLGAGVSLVWRLLYHASWAWQGAAARPDTVSPELLLGLRSAASEVIEVIPHAIRETLLFFLILFLLRVLLRSQPAALAGFAALLTAPLIFSGASWLDTGMTVIVYLTVGAVVLRFGLLALACAIFVDGIIGDLAYTVNTSSWYFGTSLMMIVLVLGLMTWAFRQAVAGKTLFRSGLPE
jgi:serine/threonine-protein kinase